MGSGLCSRVPRGSLIHERRRGRLRPNSLLDARARPMIPVSPVGAGDLFDLARGLDFGGSAWLAMDRNRERVCLPASAFHGDSVTVVWTSSRAVAIVSATAELEAKARAVPEDSRARADGISFLVAGLRRDARALSLAGQWVRQWKKPAVKPGRRCASFREVAGPVTGPCRARAALAASASRK